MNGFGICNSSQEKKMGRKRRRNEQSRRASSSNLPLFLPIALASISIASVWNESTFVVSAFHQREILSKTNSHASREAVQTTNIYAYRQNRSQRHSRITRKFWALVKANAIDEDNEGNGGDGIDNALVVSTHSSSPPLPPWLELIEEQSASFSSHAEASRGIRREIERLEESLLSFRGGDFFSESDVEDVIRAIHWSASSNSEDRSSSQRVSKIVGSVAFCRLLLKLEHDSFDKSKRTPGRSENNKTIKKNKSFFITKDVLLASILHYSGCLNARYDGVYEEVQGALWGSQTDGNEKFGEDQFVGTSVLQAPVTLSTSTFENEEGSEVNYSKAYYQDGSALVLLEDAIKHRIDQDSSTMTHKSKKKEFEDIFSREVLELAKATTRLKRIEILTSVTLTSRDQRNSAKEPQRRPLKKEEYEVARNLMVSLTEDWRALAIRCAASLFRLEGVLEHSKIYAGTGEFRKRSAEITLAAKDSLRMYANLSQQMGLHRLHTQLEAKAFRILYPRQYSASSSLFREHGPAMNVISEFLSNQLNTLLCDDISLMYELENLEVSSRVKEPYSFWKKLLKTRIRPVLTQTSDDDNRSKTVVRTELHQKRQLTKNDISIVEVNDGVALRVILKARKQTEDELAETTQQRERLLCYYVQHLVRSRWPETDAKRVKDYIRYPKPNGYQSLHHTSKVTWNNQDFFFEVQIRSEEMHQHAEFGVAAHSTYKLSGSNSSPSAYPPLNSLPSRSTLASSSSVEGYEVLSKLSTLKIAPNLMYLGASSSLLPVSGGNDPEGPGPYISALERSRQNLLQSQVYVFLAGKTSPSAEQGRLLNLSVGSLVVDVLDTLRRVDDKFTFKDNEVHVWLNGKLSLLEETIKNGDMIVVEPLSLPITEISVNKTLSPLSSDPVLVR